MFHWNQYDIDQMAEDWKKRRQRQILRWREKVIRATESADCAEIGTFRKIERFAHFGEIGE
jgi:hypothetical protein